MLDKVWCGQQPKNQRKKERKSNQRVKFTFLTFFAQKCISFVIDGKIFEISEFAISNLQLQNIFEKLQVYCIILHFNCSRLQHFWRFINVILCNYFAIVLKFEIAIAIFFCENVQNSAIFMAKIARDRATFNCKNIANKQA